MSVQPLRHRPVPDPRPAVELVPPDEPDTGRSAARPRTTRPPGVQGVLRLVLAEPPDQDDFGPLPTATADLPDPRAWSHGLVQVLIEVLAGLRPGHQLLRWTTPAVAEVVRRHTLPALLATRNAPRRRPVVRRILVGEPADGVAEVCAIVVAPGRTRALALRLEGRDGRWRVTALSCG